MKARQGGRRKTLSTKFVEGPITTVCMSRVCWNSGCRATVT
jgi:hypothetical protein